MKHGTILKNLYQPSYESLLVYIGLSGRYAKCLWLINGEFLGIRDFYKNDILYDRDHFPIVGFVDYKKVMVNAIRNGMKQEASDG